MSMENGDRGPDRPAFRDDDRRDTEPEVELRNILRRSVRVTREFLDTSVMQFRFVEDDIAPGVIPPDMTLEALADPFLRAGDTLVTQVTRHLNLIRSRLAAQAQAVACREAEIKGESTAAEAVADSTCDNSQNWPASPNGHEDSFPAQEEEACELASGIEDRFPNGSSDNDKTVVFNENEPLPEVGEVSVCVQNVDQQVCISSTLQDTQRDSQILGKISLPNTELQMPATPDVDYLDDPPGSNTSVGTIRFPDNVYNSPSFAEEQEEEAVFTNAGVEPVQQCVQSMVSESVRDPIGFEPTCVDVSNPDNEQLCAESPDSMEVNINFSGENEVTPIPIQKQVESATEANMEPISTGEHNASTVETLAASTIDGDTVQNLAPVELTDNQVQKEVFATAAAKPATIGEGNVLTVIPSSPDFPSSTPYYETVSDEEDPFDFMPTPGFAPSHNNGSAIELTFQPLLDVPNVDDRSQSLSTSEPDVECTAGVSKTEGYSQPGSKNSKRGSLECSVILQRLSSSVLETAKKQWTRRYNSGLGLGESQNDAEREPETPTEVEEPESEGEVVESEQATASFVSPDSGSANELSKEQETTATKVFLDGLLSRLTNALEEFEKFERGELNIDQLLVEAEAKLEREKLRMEMLKAYGTSSVARKEDFEKRKTHTEKQQESGVTDGEPSERQSRSVRNFLAKLNANELSDDDEEDDISDLDNDSTTSEGGLTFLREGEIRNQEFSNPLPLEAMKTSSDEDTSSEKDLSDATEDEEGEIVSESSANEPCVKRSKMTDSESPQKKKVRRRKKRQETKVDNKDAENVLKDIEDGLADLEDISDDDDNENNSNKASQDTPTQRKRKTKSGARKTKDVENSNDEVTGTGQSGLARRVIPPPVVTIDSGSDSESQSHMGSGRPRLLRPPRRRNPSPKGKIIILDADDSQETPEQIEEITLDDDDEIQVIEGTAGNELLKKRRTASVIPIPTTPSSSRGQKRPMIPETIVELSSPCSVSTHMPSESSSSSSDESDDWDLDQRPGPPSKMPRIDNNERDTSSVPPDSHTSSEGSQQELKSDSNPQGISTLATPKTLPDQSSSGSGETQSVGDSQESGGRTVARFSISAAPLKRKPKKIRDIIERLTEEGKKAVKDREELEEQTQKLEEKNRQQLSLILSDDPFPVEVDFSIAKELKPHQREGIVFMWTLCIQSVAKAHEPGNGGILSHCMGLGKTLQTLAFLHTLLTHDALGINHCLVLCPLNITSNWEDESKLWLKNVNRKCNFYNLSHHSSDAARLGAIKAFQETGGIAVVHYEGFMSLLLDKKVKQPSISENENHILPIPSTSASGLKDKIKSLAEEVLLNVQVLVCDEGHTLRNGKTRISKLIKRVTTKRKIILTGTPMQNNLKEYYYMIDVVQPNVLGKYTDFTNMYINPIQHGQHVDSEENDINRSKRREFLLWERTSGFIHRRFHDLLRQWVPPKHEYGIFLNLTDLQKRLYSKYLLIKRKGEILKDYHVVQKLSCHPALLYKDFQKSQAAKKGNKTTNFGKGSEEIVTAENMSLENDGLEIDERWLDSVIPQEARELISTDVSQACKMIVLKEILQKTIAVGEKVLVFSRYVSTLNIIQRFVDTDAFGLGTLVDEQDYYRIDGTTTTETRHKYCCNFNKSKRAKLFLISTKAGGLGVNLHSANRVVMMEVSFNPSDDEQSIFRIYRLGQKKTCYVYRLIARGGMEEKNYNRCLVKLAVGGRIVDKQQSVRHVKLDNTVNMYEFNPESVPVGTVDPNKPVEDPVLKQLLQNTQVVASYVEHQTLLEDSVDEHLNDEQKEFARKEEEEEKELKKKEDEMPTATASTDPKKRGRQIRVVKKTKSTQGQGSSSNRSPPKRTYSEDTELELDDNGRLGTSVPPGQYSTFPDPYDLDFLYRTSVINYAEPNTQDIEEVTELGSNMNIRPQFSTPAPRNQFFNKSTVRLSRSPPPQSLNAPSIDPYRFSDPDINFPLPWLGSTNFPPRVHDPVALLPPPMYPPFNSSDRFYSQVNGSLPPRDPQM